jgi:hemerythrin
MQSNNILNLMTAQHGLIESLYFLYKDELGTGSEKAKQSLSELSWELKKHFFIEEGVIFDFFKWDDLEMLQLIKRLRGEHAFVIDKLAEIEQNPSKATKEAIAGLYDLLINHRTIEEEKLYPAFDEKLSDFQREKIVLRVNEIPLKK